jgi:RecA/RadA recombinase
VDDVSKFIGELIEEYKIVNSGKKYSERGKMIIVLDSLGMLITPNQEKQFMEGDQKGDMGIKAKQVTAMLRVLLSKIGSQPIGIFLTNHVFDSQDKYSPDSIAGGKMVEFSTSVIAQINKWLLKEDGEGKETKDVTGIRATVVVRKSRYAKPFEKVKIDIPYTTGMDPYSGLFDLFKAKGLFNQTGSWYTYTSPSTGEIIKHQGSSTKKWKSTFDLIMDEWDQYWENPAETIGFDETGSGFAEDSNVDGEK